MPAGAFLLGKSHQRFRATQRLKERRGARREWVALCLGYQRGTLDELGASFHREELRRSQVCAQIVNAMHPEAALDDLPVKLAIVPDESVDSVEHRLLEFTEIRRGLASDPEHAYDYVAEKIGDAPGSRVRHERRNARLARSAARREVATEAPATERDARRIDDGLRHRQVDDGPDNSLPVRPQRNALLIEHRALPGAVEQEGSDSPVVRPLRLTRNTCP